MERLIDADRLKQVIADNVYLVQDAFNSRDYGMFWTGGIEKAIDDAPTVDAVEVVRCKDCKFYWKNDSCSFCGETVLVPTTITGIPTYNYCPNCGAKMDEVEK